MFRLFGLCSCELPCPSGFHIVAYSAPSEVSLSSPLFIVPAPRARQAARALTATGAPPVIAPRATAEAAALVELLTEQITNMRKVQPIEISDAEWEEIMQVRDVRKALGIADGETLHDLRRFVWGVKFKFLSRGEGHVGDLFIIQGDALETRIAIIRIDGKLRNSDGF